MKEKLFQTSKIYMNNNYPTGLRRNGRSSASLLGVEAAFELQGSNFIHIKKSF